MAQRSRWALEVNRRLVQREKLVLWEDRFERADGLQVSNGWQEDERYGVRISLSQGKVAFGGRQQGLGWERTKLVRRVDTRKVAAVEARLDGKGLGDKCYAGVIVESIAADGSFPCAVAVLRDRAGRLRYMVRKRAGKWDSPKGLTGIAKDGSAIGVHFQGQQRNRLVFKCGNAKVGSTWAPDWSQDVAFQVGLVGTGPKDMNWAFKGDDFRIIMEED